MADAASERATIILFGTVLYIAAHLVFYALWARRRSLFKAEKPIFYYHLVSVIFLLLVVTALIGGRASTRNLAAGVAALSVHGIYTISFLELWSLAQGGFSLSILQIAAAGGDPGRKDVVRELQAIGDGKRSDRLRALQQMGLVAQQPAGLVLTRAGVAACVLLRMIVRTANLRSLG